MLIANPSGSNVSQAVYRQINIKDKLKQNEMLSCPRCKIRLIHEIIYGPNQKELKIWWLCPKAEKCLFPFDMPNEVYSVTRTYQMAKDNFFPPPDIFLLPAEYRHMYPLNFQADASVAPLGVYSTRAHSNSLKGSLGKESLPMSKTSSMSDGVDSEDFQKMTRIGHPSESVHSDGTLSTTGYGESDDIDGDSEQPRRQTRMMRISSRSGAKSLCQRIIDQLSSNDGETMDSLMKMNEEKLAESIRKSLEMLKNGIPVRLCNKRGPVRTYPVDEFEKEFRQDFGVWKKDESSLHVKEPQEMMYAMKNATTADELIEAIGLKKNAREISNTGASTIRRMQKKKEILDQRVQTILAKMKIEVDGIKNKSASTSEVVGKKEEDKKKTVEDSRKRKAALSAHNRIKRKLEEVKARTMTLNTPLNSPLVSEQHTWSTMDLQQNYSEAYEEDHGSHIEDSTEHSLDFVDYDHQQYDHQRHQQHLQQSQVNYEDAPTDFSLNLEGILHDEPDGQSYQQEHQQQQPEILHVNTASMNDDEFSSMFDL